jgi:hypothetical protein
MNFTPAFSNVVRMALSGSARGCTSPVSMRASVRMGTPLTTESFSRDHLISPRVDRICSRVMDILLFGITRSAPWFLTAPRAFARQARIGTSANPQSLPCAGRTYPEQTYPTKCYFGMIRIRDRPT